MTTLIWTLLGTAISLGAWYLKRKITNRGRSDVQVDILEQDAKIFKEQRDNDIVDADDADKLFSRLRNRKSK